MNLQIDYSNEEWRQLPDELSDYDVSDFGRVRRHRSKKLLQCEKNNGGYVVTYLKTKHGTASYSLHLLVALAFLPERPYPLARIIHINGSLIDNRPSNLKWTQQKTPPPEKDETWQRRLCESCKYSHAYNKIRKKLTKRYCTNWKKSGHVRVTVTTPACELYERREPITEFVF